MSTQKSVFEVKDPTPPQFSVKDPTPPQFNSEECHEKKYMGPERRRENRRSGHDRRLDIRFEISAEDRRQSHGRRECDKAPTFW